MGYGNVENTSLDLTSEWFTSDQAPGIVEQEIITEMSARCYIYSDYHWQMGFALDFLNHFRACKYFYKPHRKQKFYVQNFVITIAGINWLALTTNISQH